MSKMFVPSIKATVIDKTGSEHSVTDDLISFKMDQSDEESANKIELRFQNENGKYDKFRSGLSSGREIKSISHPTTTWCLDVDRYSDRVLVGEFGGALHEWNINTEVENYFRGSNDSVYSVQYSMNDNHALISRYTEDTILIDLVSGEVLYQSDELHGEVTCSALSPDDKLIAEGGLNSISVFESGLNGTTAGANRQTFSVQDSRTDELVFSADGEYLYWGTDAGKVYQYTLSDGTIVSWATHDLVADRETITGIDISPDGTTVVVSTTAPEIISIDVPTGNSSVLFEEPTSLEFNSVKFSNNGEMIVFTANVGDGTGPGAYVQQLSSGDILAEFDGHTTAEVKDAVFTYDDTKVLSVGTDKSLRLWRVFLDTSGDDSSGSIFVDNSMFQENRKIRIEEERAGAWHDVGVFNIRRVVPSKMERGGEETITVSCFDLSKNLLRAKVTTNLYENMTVKAIAEDVLLNYADLTAEEFDMPSLGIEISQVQFIGEYIWDILIMLLQTGGYTPGVDRHGVVVGRKGVDPNDYTVSKTLDHNAPIKWYKSEWNDDDLHNSVKVIGKDYRIGETVKLPEELLFTATKSLDRKDHEKTEKYYYFDDHSKEAFNVRITWTDLVEPMDTSDYVYIRNMTTTWIEIAYHNENHNTTDADFEVQCYGRPMGQALPEPIIEVAQDETLVAEYGIRQLEIDNPLLDTSAKVQALADRELQKSLWSRNRVSLETAYDNEIDVGDFISVYHHKYEKYLTLYVESLSLEYEEGSKYVSTFNTNIIVY